MYFPVLSAILVYLLGFTDNHGNCCSNWLNYGAGQISVLALWKRDGEQE